MINDMSTTKMSRSDALKMAEELREEYYRKASLATIEAMIDLGLYDRALQEMIESKEWFLSGSTEGCRTCFMTVLNGADLPQLIYEHYDVLAGLEMLADDLYVDRSTLGRILGEKLDKCDMVMSYVVELAAVYRGWEIPRIKLSHQ